MMNPTYDNEFSRRFLTRTRVARERAGFTQDQMARLLGVKLATYNKYETRTLMPLLVHARFCIEVGVPPNWFFGLPTRRGPTKRCKP